MIIMIKIIAMMKMIRKVMKVMGKNDASFHNTNCENYN